MDAPPAAALRNPCSVCAAPNGKHCTKCKSRQYCSKACQLVDWNERGHKAQCKQMAAQFQDRLLDELMPEKLKIKEDPAIVEAVAPASGLKAAARLTAVQTGKSDAKASAPNDDAPDWRGTCAVCLDKLPVGQGTQRFYSCCCKITCTACGDKCVEYDNRCPFCRASAPTSQAEWLRRMQKHVDKGDANAQHILGDRYHVGAVGIQQSYKQAFRLYSLAAEQGHAVAQCNLGLYYDKGHVKIDNKAAAQLYRRAAEQGLPQAQSLLGRCYSKGKGVAQSYGEAVKWYRLAAAQSDPQAFYELGGCYVEGQGVPRDYHEALRFFKRAAAKGHAVAAAQVEKLGAFLAAARAA